MFLPLFLIQWNLLYLSFFLLVVTSCQNSARFCHLKELQSEKKRLKSTVSHIYHCQVSVARSGWAHKTDHANNYFWVWYMVYGDIYCPAENGVQQWDFANYNLVWYPCLALVRQSYRKLQQKVLWKGGVSMSEESCQSCLKKLCTAPKPAMSNSRDGNKLTNLLESKLISDKVWKNTNLFTAG